MVNVVGSLLLIICSALSSFTCEREYDRLVFAIDPDAKAGRDAYRQGDMMKAFKQLKPILAKVASGPEDALILKQALSLCVLADCYERQGSYAESEKLLRHALTLVGNTPEAWRIELEYGAFEARRQKFTDAENHLQSALRTCLKNKSMSNQGALCQFELGELFEVQGEHEKAIKYYQDAMLQSAPDSGAMYYKAWANAAHCYVQMGDKAQAETAYEKLLEKLENSRNNNARYAVLGTALNNRIALLKEHNESSELIAKLEKQRVDAENAARAFVFTDEEPVEGSNKQGNVDFGPYMNNLSRLIKKHWKLTKFDQDRLVVVTFRVTKEGDMSDLKLATTSGTEKADEAALEAVRIAAPFPALPAGAPSFVDIQFTFDYKLGAKKKPLSKPQPRQNQSAPESQRPGASSSSPDKTSQPTLPVPAAPASTKPVP